MIIYLSRSLDIGKTQRYMELLESRRVTRLYLDELVSQTHSIGIETVKLIIESEERAVAKGKQLIEQARVEVIDEVAQGELIQLIETIIVYKLSNKSREEIIAMLGLNEFKQTRVYQDVFHEGVEEGLQEGERRAKLESVPRLFALGLSVEQIATALQLDVQQVRQIAQQQSPN